jgi:hypothetical protein
MNLSHVTIFATHMRSTGAVHVTNCHVVTLVLSETQQLRLHDSTDLTCHVPNPATIGAILEGCTRIVFVIPPSSSSSVQQSSIGSNDRPTEDSKASAATRQEQQKQPPTPPLLDAKDFNWLRTGIPSPNFSVIVQEPPPVPIHGDDHDHEKPHDHSTTDTQSNTNPTVIMTTAPNSLTKSSPIIPQTANDSSESTSTIVETLKNPFAPSGTMSVGLAEEAPNTSVQMGDGEDDDDDDELWTMEIKL